MEILSCLHIIQCEFFSPTRNKCIIDPPSQTESLLPGACVFREKYGLVGRRLDFTRMSNKMRKFTKHAIKLLQQTVAVSKNYYVS